jgi:transposase
VAYRRGAKTVGGPADLALAAKQYVACRRDAGGTARPSALGKKNWLFTGSERSGQRAAAIQTLLGTAKLNGLNSADWLNETLEKLPVWPNSRIDELLPLTPEQIEAIKQKLPENAKW